METSDPDYKVSGSAPSSGSGSTTRSTRPTYDFRQDELSLGTRKRNRDPDEAEDDEEEEEEIPGRKKNPGRRKIDIEYIHDKGKRHITFSKRKAGIMKKAYELATLTGTQLLLLVVSDSGVVYTFTTPKLETIVSEQPGKDIILKCLADGSSELQIQRESPSETTPILPKCPLPEQEFLEEASGSQANTRLTDGMNSLEQPYALNPCEANGSASFGPLGSHPYISDHNQSMLPSYDPLILGHHGVENLYGHLGDQLMNDATNSYSSLSHTITNRPSGSASYLDMNLDHTLLRGDSGNSITNPAEYQSIKRRKTDTDLRSRSRADNNPATSQYPPLPNQFSADIHNPWNDNHVTMKYNMAQQARILALQHPTITNSVSAFLMSEYLRHENAVSFESEPREDLNRLERTMKLFLDACDQSPMSNIHSTGGKSWKDETPPSYEVLGKCLSFFLQDYLHIQSFVDYINVLYDQPVVPPTSISELTAVSAGTEDLQIASTSAEPVLGAVSTVPSLSPVGRSKTAPKLKPRKGVNVSLRGGRLSTNLEEYTAWCRQNKTSWSGNNPQSTLVTWFKIERVRRTFCCCIPEYPSETQLENVLKIRFPASAIKLIRKHDRLKLEIKKADDGSEWNIFQHLDSDLYPEDESDEDEISFPTGDKPIDPEAIDSVAKEKGIALDQAKSFLDSRRLMRQQIEAGDYEDDGFESKVPPKGGKQAFRVKRPPSKLKRQTSPLNKAEDPDIQVGLSNQTSTSAS
ncbi:hypothetical protein DFH28DRAFT_1023220 [Melampsora americana]|nr:hypothetical protein DFH28DRAFT_1023220 [Melampsora americana]